MRIEWKQFLLKEFPNGNCAQATAFALLNEFNLPENQLKNALYGFGGGIHLMGNTCGAVTGTLAAVGVISDKFGLDDEKKSNLLDELIIEAQKEFPSFFCREIIGGVPKELFKKMSEGRMDKKEMEKFMKICNNIVGNFPIIALRILKQYQPR